ncbi:hypothetical protein GV794_02000 [Nocardia cyriacigeorgica]|uniref:Uncharacterized protein n=1 Tax=Nocardia cyriacigeorgica TaxID=135487 RepID=A0ABX0CD02_9NOCA|nr:hypothetical protein [Nocardia cyriacigeorgica]NEW42733.1 hypothetical protein [Nocardia cyriacigeorgica]NEW53972.1 hypothetical protein [Nocardia cyriacigeorgica]NEW54439.1 hypothetical protein [Nocardia cyriacigeorgica]
MSAEDWDDGPASEDWLDRLDIIRVRTRRRFGGLLRLLRLHRLADRLDPPPPPWYLRKPLGYHEHFVTEDEARLGDAPGVVRRRRPRACSLPRRPQAREADRGSDDRTCADVVEAAIRPILRDAALAARQIAERRNIG